MTSSERFTEKVKEELMKQNPEVFNCWMHLYGNKWMNTYSLEIRVMRWAKDWQTLARQ